MPSTITQSALSCRACSVLGDSYLSLARVQVQPEGFMAAAHRPYLTYTLAVLLCAVFGLELAFGVAPPDKPMTPALDTLIAMGGLNKTLVLNGEVYRLVSAIFLHASPAHLAGNAIVLLLAGYALERYAGPARLLIVFSVCGLAGSLGSLLWHERAIVAAGASGAILGVLFAALICTHRLPKGFRRLRARIWLTLVVALALIPDPTGGSKDILVDFGAHVAGSLAGVLAGIWIVAAWPSDRAAPLKALPLTASACLALFGGTAVWSAVHYTNVEALYSGNAAFLEKDYGRAALEYGEAIRRNPQNPAAYFGRALAFQQAGQVENAIADYKTALTLSPRNPDFLLTLGELYSDWGDQAQAGGYIAQAIELQPDNPMAYIARGIMKFRSGGSNEAIADFDKAVELNPKEANGYNSRAFTYLAMGKLSEAHADILKALTFAPGEPAILDTEGHILVALGRPKEALRSFNQVLEGPNGKQYAASFYGRGLAYEKLQSKALAIRDYRSALDIKVWDIEEKEAQQKARARLEALTGAPAEGN